MDDQNINKHAGHELVKEIVYGPVLSRRYGSSLGINLLPQDKHCNFNCGYCQLGLSNTAYAPDKAKFPSSEQVLAALEVFFAKDPKKMDAIVISGNGEPTLHPEFATITDQLLGFFNKHQLNVPVICFTNGTTLQKPKIFQALQKYQECCLKLDFDPVHSNKPIVPFSFDDLLPAIELENLVIQTCIFSDPKISFGDEELGAWLNQVKRLKPNRVDLYTISRDTPDKTLKPMKSILSIVANMLEGHGIPARIS